MATFLPGAELAQGFYEEVVRPLLGGTVHAAALLGTGSDVLGFDTARSTDHGWGPRMHLFVEEAEVAGVAALVDEGLPETYRGWPTRFGWDAVPVQHHVVVRSLGGWLKDHIGVDPREGLRTADWLFHGRPFRVIGSARFADACLERVQDPWLRGLPLVGAVDQLVDSTDVLESPGVARRLVAIYDQA